MVNLVEPFARKTNKRYNGAAIYTLEKDIGCAYLGKGNYFYLDTGHSNNHIEVFDHRKRAKAVIDLSGKLLEGKTIAAIRDQRTIKHLF